MTSNLRILFRVIFNGFIFALFHFTSVAQTDLSSPTFEFAVMQYNGGGDWYSNPTSMPNLVRFCNENLGMNISEEVPYVGVGSADLSMYPFVHMTGHGNVVLSSSEARNLREYLSAGGFLHISDNYGMDKYIRQEIKKVFPELEWVEIPFDHPVYHQKYNFTQGLPKVHEHNDHPPRGFGIFFEGRLVCFYDHECDLGDGWEDYQVHRDPEEIRLLALQMGANLVQYALGGD
ncbi:MAG: hypothetical protein CMB32_01920 [Euryarchaeota archaeon]|nr:hypothetical protein [Euryarchaeota archaeon]|tara:strand:+ start:273 stop:968 length:696 start_codon:yes stop_codon:yes gene_type:complete